MSPAQIMQQQSKWKILAFKCHSVRDRDALYRVFRNLIAMNRDQICFINLSLNRAVKIMSPF